MPSRFGSTRPVGLNRPTRALALAVALALSVFASAGCGKDDPTRANGSKTTDTAPSPPPVTGPHVAFDTPNGPVEVRVVIARTPDETRRGLMFVDKLEDGRGMLFLMPERRIQRFWMVNTYISLDMIFIDEDFKVAGIVENTEPLTETPRFVDHPSRYVLEVRGGYARSVGIAKDQTARFVQIPL